jgi:hypothetical protein
VEAMSGKQKDKSNGESSSKILEIISKLGPAIASVIAVIGAALIANSFQSKMSATSLISQRELAESQLRASMFRDLIGAVMETTAGGKNGTKINIDHEQLLIELLALNFSGQFDSKPLLLHLDKSIAAELKGERKKEARESLRSIARRVRDLQVARLLNAGTKGDKTQIEPLIVKDTTQDEKQKQEYEKLKKYYLSVSNTYKAVPVQYGQLGEAINLESPDKKHTLTIIVNDCDWDDQTCKVLLTVKKNVLDSEKYDEINQPFTLTWFDFPLTDNTLLADGNRFALVFDSIDTDLKSVALRLIWFPKVYFTPQERPINFADISEKLGFKSKE